MDKYSPHKTSKTRQSGFTLIELMLSLTILALAMTILGAGFHMIANGWATAGEKAERQDMMIRGLAIIRRDFEGLERQIKTPGQQPEFLFKGSGHNARFIVIEPPYPTRSGPYFIQYSVSKNQNKLLLMRSRQSYRSEKNTGLQGRQENEVVLLEGDYNYRFSYKGDAASASIWSESWNLQNELPTMIRFEIRDPRNGRHVLPPFIIQLRHDAELGCLTKNNTGCTLDIDRTIQASGKPRDARTGENL